MREPNLFSKELILKAFPHKEAILFNLDVAIELSIGKDSLKEEDRIDFLCDCHTAIVNKDIKLAVKLAEQANYRLMARAIQYHWGENK